ncbi:hypothetical protein KM295_07315 [Natronomonas sp. F2-12]|jgi:hypothetical protein|uniref:Uncharacterized protein n=1 Tax=Natronomonas aquatica TaxID=2841590 RepID=A0A9R1CQM6_9EURY|nr:hypothetical protein [Natronomonas aquatica]MCQ4333289.1 hypothetical protein [Natronomonas aquatica]
MTVAAETRKAVREHPFVYDGLRAGIVNYTAAARFLDVGDTEAVGAALRRYAEDLSEYAPPDARGTVSMRSGVGETDDVEGLLAVGNRTFGIDGGEHTAIVATGEFDASALGAILARLRTAEIEVVAAAGAEGTATVVVERRAGPDAVRVVEGVL